MASSETVVGLSVTRTQLGLRHSISLPALVDATQPMAARLA